MRILFVGDTHGHKFLPGQISKHAADTGHDLIIQVGDFGYGWDSRPLDGFIENVGKSATEHGIDWAFIDGNHDNHPKLWRDNQSNWPDNVTYLGRGDVADFGGVKVGFLGGGLSVDKRFRKVGKSWWPTEEISDDELDISIANFKLNQVKLIVTHDAPLLAPALKHGNTDANSPWPIDIIAEANRHRRRLDTVLRAIDPALWIHGHFHYPYRALVGDTTFIGLDQADRGGYTRDSEFKSMSFDADVIADATVSIKFEDGKMTVKA